MTESNAGSEAEAAAELGQKNASQPRLEPPRREVVFSRGLRVLLICAAVAYVLYWLRDVLTPIFLAFTIAYILDPVVDRLESVRVPRPVGIIVVLGTLVALVGLFLTLVLPSIANDTAAVISELPQLAASALAKGEAWLVQRGVQVPQSIQEWIERFGGQLQGAAGTLVGSASGALGWLLGGSASLLGSAFGALIVPVFAIYLLNDFDRIVAGVRALIPIRHRDSIVGYAREIDLVLSQFMRGQVIVMLVLAALYGAAYALLGVRLAVAIGITAGILNFIPYLGSAFALAAGLLMSLLGGWNPTQLVGVVVAYAVVQSLEGFVITPRIVGKTVGLSDVWVLLALFVGGELFGFLGVLLAVPVAAVAKIFIVRSVRRYLASEMYGAKPSEPAA